MRRAPTLLLGLLLMSGVCAAPRPLQASQQASDSLSFAGGTRFQFLLPVRGMGPVQAQVSWSPAVEAQAYLFTPSQKTPVTSSRGRGALTLVHPILAPTGGEWMLEIVVQTDDPNVSGTVRLTWPGAAGSQLVWRNAGPTDPHIQERLAQLSTSLANVLQGRTPRNDAERGLQARLTEQPELRAELQRIQTVASVRLPVLRQVAPARVRNDFTFQQVQPVERVQVRPLQPVRPAQPLQPAPPPAGEPALPQRPTLEPGLALSARFMLLNCFSEMTWDRGSDSDEPYALIGFIRQSGGEAVGGRTRVFSDVDDGEQRPTGVANQELARFYLDSRSFFVMAMMENDEGNPSLVLNRFLRSLELGIDMVGEGWGWWEFLPVAGWIWSALGNRDDLIGNARSMTITPDGWYNEQGNLMTWNTSTEYGLGPIVTWDFRGDGGHYGIMLRLEPIRVHSVQSFNYPDLYFRHRDYQGQISAISSDLDRQDATFLAVPGLANDQHVSFESLNYPGYYLTDEDGRLMLRQRPADNLPTADLFKRMSTFKRVAGLAEGSWMSFESYFYAGRYIRHRNYQLFVEPGQDDMFRRDATFLLTGPWWKG